MIARFAGRHSAASDSCRQLRSGPWSVFGWPYGRSSRDPRVEPAAARFVEDKRGRARETERHIVAFTMPGFRAGLEKTNDSEGAVSRVEHFSPHRLGGGDEHGRPVIR